MTWWEDLNLGRRSFIPVEKQIHQAVEREQRKFCPFLSNDGDRSQTVLLPVCSHLLVVVLAVHAFLLKDVEAKEMACHLHKEMDRLKRGHFFVIYCSWRCLRFILPFGLIPLSG
jgi:hypothetical protein